MLRNRSRAVTSKQPLMADQASFLSPTKNPTSPFSSFLNSPRFFNGFLSKSVLDAETMSPTSILDSRNFSNLSNPFRCDTKPPTSPHRDFISPKNSATEAIGLGLIDSIAGEDSDQSGGGFSKPINRMALFGSKLKVKIPELSSSVSPAESPRSPADFGIKTRSTQLLSPFGGGSPAKDLARQLSLKEIETSEDYTCVIKHGPNPKTRHIYDDCILNADEEEEEEEEEEEGVNVSPRPEVEKPDIEKPDFLSFCHGCKLGLGLDKDIFMYRGEKAFCSQECRCQEMIFDEAL